VEQARELAQVAAELASLDAKVASHLNTYAWPDLYASASALHRSGAPSDLYAYASSSALYRSESPGTLAGYADLTAAEVASKAQQRSRSRSPRMLLATSDQIAPPPMSGSGKSPPRDRGRYSPSFSFANVPATNPEGFKGYKEAQPGAGLLGLPVGGANFVHAFSACMPMDDVPAVAVHNNPLQPPSRGVPRGLPPRPNAAQQAAPKRVSIPSNDPDEKVNVHMREGFASQSQDDMSGVSPGTYSDGTQRATHQNTFSF
jgi:hypothetical protein